MYGALCMLVLGLCPKFRRCHACVLGGGYVCAHGARVGVPVLCVCDRMCVMCLYARVCVCVVCVCLVCVYMYACVCVCGVRARSACFRSITNNFLDVIAGPQRIPS